MFPNINRIKNIKCQICIIHAVKDDIVPIEHGKELYEEAINKFDPFFADGPHHNNMEIPEIYLHVDKFL